MHNVADAASSGKDFRKESFMSGTLFFQAVQDRQANVISSDSERSFFGLMMKAKNCESWRIAGLVAKVKIGY